MDAGPGGATGVGDPLRLRRHGSADALLADSGDFLAAREAEHNLLLGIAGTLRADPAIYPETPYLADVRDATGIRLVAIRTPPFNLVLSESDRPESVELVADDLASSMPGLPGVTAPKAIASRFADAWGARTGRAAQLDVEERIFRLRGVVAPADPGGSWRSAGEGDRRLVTDWLHEFQREALANEPPPPDLDRLVDGWLRGGERAMYLWEVGGRAVSMVAAGSPTPHGIRIGPVYTPPADRGRGYASALTAAVSRHELDRGRTFCFLFTDLANPTSNHIYQVIGFQPVADSNQYRFAV